MIKYKLTKHKFFSIKRNAILEGSLPYIKSERPFYALANWVSRNESTEIVYFVKIIDKGKLKIVAFSNKTGKILNIRWFEFE